MSIAIGEVSHETVESSVDRHDPSCDRHGPLGRRGRGRRAPREVLTARNFRFEIEGRDISALSVTPGAILVPAVLSSSTESRTGAGNTTQYDAGKVEYANWQVTKVLDRDDPTLYDLAVAASEGRQSQRTQGSLTYLDADGQPARRIDFFEYQPVWYVTVFPVGGSAATETLEFSVQRVEFAGDNVAAAPTSDGATYATLQPDRPAISRFTFDFGLGAASSDWTSVVGGARALGAVTTSTSGDRTQESTIGATEFTDVSVVGPFLPTASDLGVEGWFQGWITGKSQPTNAELALMDSEGNEVQTINFLRNIPRSYTPPAVDAKDDSRLQERFSFKPNDVTRA